MFFLHDLRGHPVVFDDDVIDDRVKMSWISFDRDRGSVCPNKFCIRALGLHHLDQLFGEWFVGALLDTILLPAMKSYIEMNDVIRSMRQNKRQFLIEFLGLEIRIFPRIDICFPCKGGRDEFLVSPQNGIPDQENTGKRWIRDHRLFESPTLPIRYQPRILF